MTDDATNQPESDKLDLKIKEAEARAAEAAANQAESDARAAEAAANQAEAEAEVGGISKLAENLSAVERGTLTTTGDHPVAFNALANKALTKAAGRAAETLKVLKDQQVFVTIDPDLATADAPYIQVSNQLEALCDQANELHEKAKQLLREENKDLASTSVAAAALSTVPAIIGALSPNRTVSSSAGEVDDLNAAIAMMGALIGSCESIILDDFRTVPPSDIMTQFTSLQDCRQKLAEQRRAIPEPPPDEKQTDDKKSGEFKLLAAKLDALIAEIDKYTAYVVAPISEGKRSPLAQASLQTTLRPEKGGYTHALLVKGAGTSSFQVTTDKSLWFEDKISVVAHASIAFVAIDLNDNSQVVASGIVTGEAQMKGVVGDEIEAHAATAEPPWATTAQVETIKADLKATEAKVDKMIAETLPNNQPPPAG